MTKVALRSLQRRLARWQKMVSLSEAKEEELIDPTSDLPTAATDLDDLLRTLFRILGRKQKSLLLSIIDGAVIRRLTFTEMATKLKIPLRTLERLHTKLQTVCASWYSKEECDGSPSFQSRSWPPTSKPMLREPIAIRPKEVDVSQSQGAPERKQLSRNEKRGRETFGS